MFSFHMWLCVYFARLWFCCFSFFFLPFTNILFLHFYFLSPSLIVKLLRLSNRTRLCFMPLPYHFPLFLFFFLPFHITLLLRVIIFVHIVPNLRLTTPNSVHILCHPLSCMLKSTFSCFLVIIISCFFNYTNKNNFPNST